VYDWALGEDPDLEEREMLVVLSARAAARLPPEGYFYPESFYEAMSVGLDYPPFQFNWLWAARWFSCALPHVVWSSPQFAALLLATGGVAKDQHLVDAVRPPWRAFLLDVPEGLIFARGLNGVLDPVTHVLVHPISGVDAEGRGRLYWQFVAECAGGTSLWRHGLSVEQLLAVDPETMVSAFEDHPLTGKVDEVDERAMVLIGRLIVGVCLTFSDPKKVRELRGSRKGRSVRWSVSGKAKCSSAVPRRFVFGAPVLVDARDKVASWARGENRSSRSPTVRTLVRGHWKMQPYGKGSSLRKVIWRQPFWRGPEDGPAVVRDHVVAGGIEDA
jgi:hypothetical protein